MSHVMLDRLFSSKRNHGHEGCLPAAAAEGQVTLCITTASTTAKRCCWVSQTPVSKSPQYTYEHVYILTMLQVARLPCTA